MLFQDNTYFHHKFPEPQYLGAKYIWLSWLNKFIPKNITIALDAFAGSQSVAYLFKQRGIKTITNDFLNFNNQIGKSLIENSNVRLSNEDYDFIVSNEPKNLEDYKLFQNTYSDVFFDDEQASFLDKVRSNIECFDDLYKKALAITLINRSLTRKVTMGHFAHTQAINYANNPERVRRNPNLAKHIKEIFKELMPIYNQAIFDNGQDNISYNENIVDLLPKFDKVDLAYFDPPYCDSHADYQALVSELFKLRYFDWGGDYKNALDKYLVDKYVETYNKYDALVSKFDKEINRAVQGYILCSWYNHWTSILIENIFKSHPCVLPTIGRIKRVDFFINNIPFDLKVTYLPANFIEAKRKEMGLKKELTELKNIAKESKIAYSNHSKSDDIYYEIVEKLKIKNDEVCNAALQNIKKIRNDILNEAILYPQLLVQNLYIVNYLDNFSKKKIDDLSLNFKYKNRDIEYLAIADILFIIK